MDGPQFFFYRGSTPTLELVLPLEVGREDTVYASFWQGNRVVVELAMNGQASPAGEGNLSRAQDSPNTLLLLLGQQDTLALQAGFCELQLRLKNQVGADTFRPLLGQIGPARKEDVLL